MSQRALSNTSFQDYGVKDTAAYQGPDAPLSASSSTLGTGAASTAWRTRSLGSGRPLPLSSRTSGSTYKFDDASSAPSFDIK
jgi:hypothetical protein